MIINGDIIQPSAGSNINLKDNSKISVDENNNISFSKNRTNFIQKPGTIIESLWSLCNGSTHVLLSGTYTVQNVTTFQTLSNIHTNIEGSVITYIPPSDATKVIYRFTYSHYWIRAGHAITHHKFLIDDIDVLYSRYNRSASEYLEQRYTFEWIIPIGGISNPNTGRQSSWTTPKTLKMQARNYATGTNDLNLHGTTYWNGGGGNVFNIPIINIIAVK